MNDRTSKQWGVLFLALSSAWPLILFMETTGIYYTRYSSGHQQLGIAFGISLISYPVGVLFLWKKLKTLATLVLLYVNGVFFILQLLAVLYVLTG